MALVLPRRKFLAGAALLFCAPAIVRAASLMPIKPLSETLYSFPQRVYVSDYQTLYFISGINLTEWSHA